MDNYILTNEKIDTPYHNLHLGFRQLHPCNHSQPKQIFTNHNSHQHQNILKVIKVQDYKSTRVKILIEKYKYKY